ncbi:restriction endonuclease subunit S [Cyanobium sp. FGCU-6]|nr:restriction endonuclease subunit S [Cyanobium sp. FGCU6]
MAILSQPRRLGELVTFKTGKLDSNAAVPNGKYPFFTCSQETLRTNTFSFDTECVLLAGNNANGIFPLKFFKGKFDAYQRTYVVRPLNVDGLATKYLYYALRPKLDELRSFSTGAATKFLTLTILNETEIAVPPLPIQRRIAAILSAYDDLIENSQRRIKILEEMARRLYREWFVHFRFPGHEDCRFVDSPLGEIPEGWEVKTVDDSFEILGGGTPSRKEDAYWVEVSINWFSPTDLTGAGTMFMDDSRDHITPLGLSESSARLFPPFCVMLTSRATIGAIAINTTEACTNQGFITCLPSREVPLYFLHSWLKENVPTFVRMASGSTFKEISRGVFKPICFLHPQADLVQMFESFAAPIGEEMLGLQRQIQILRRTRDLLLPRLLSSQIDVEALDHA